MSPDHTATRQRRRYLERVLELYRHHPHTTGHLRSADRSLADDLYRKGIDLDTIEAALLLVAARRSSSSPQPPSTIRSLHYFLPAIQEVLEHPLDDGYLTYLQDRCQQTPPSDPHLP